MLAKGFLFGNIVLGYSGIEKQSGFRNFIFREYQFNESVAWLSSAIRRRTYSASRNALGFLKGLYFEVRGFSHLNINVGEDDLFVQQIATRDNVSIVLSPRATCSERVWGGWSWWWRRTKSLHATHKYYPRWAKLPSVTELIFRVLFFAAVIAAIVLMPWEFKVAAIVMMLIRYFVVMFVFIRNARRLGEATLAPLHFIYDLIEPFIRLMVALFSCSKKKLWR